MAFTTKKSMLARVRRGDEISWKEFYDTYRPLIYLVGKDCGLEPAENEELVQNVMCEIFRKDIVGKYDPDHVPDHVSFQHDESKGRFRHYFRGIVRNQALKIYHSRWSFKMLEEVPEPVYCQRFDTSWNDNWRSHMLNQAMTELRQRVRPSTYSAFELYTLQERPVKEVAKVLNLSVDSVYVAKNRCVAALRQIIAKIEKEEK